jgi:hypothetical protein
MHAFALAKRRSDPGQAAAAFVWIGSLGERIAFVGLPLAMTAPENCSRLQPTGARQRLPDLVAFSFGQRGDDVPAI